jgi:hypothetical protein
MHENCAFYFARGIELAVLVPDEAKDWARRLVDEGRPGCDEIVDSALAFSTADLIATLREASNGADANQVAGWLIHAVMNRYRAEEFSSHDAAILALSVSASCGHIEAADKFDGICDAFSIAELGQYGTIAECVSELESAFALYGRRKPDEN